MSNNTKEIGERTEAIILASLIKAGFVVLTPFGDNQRYDLVIDYEGEFFRIQCKTGRMKNNIIRFSACSVTRANKASGASRKDYRGQIEAFGVYCPDNDKIYFVPVGDVGVEGNLRLTPPKNNQVSKVKMASSYEFDDHIKFILPSTDKNMGQ